MPASGTCSYAAVCHVAPTARPPRLATATDLLVAISQHQLHVFARRADRALPSCGCHDGGHDSDSTGLLHKHGFVCPHVTAYDDVTHALTIPIRSITQVCMTYRTASTGTTTPGQCVATRTKDLVLRASPTLVLWLEFEHNLARGWFLEALSAAVPSDAPSLDIDYVDLGDPAAVAGLTSQPSTDGFSPQGLTNAVGFLRDAWRHATYDKITLALQVAYDAPHSASDDPTVACLLTTAMELATRLDEPDLNALTWLTSGFLNFQNPTKYDLALAQVIHSVALARMNSLEFLLCLALQCSASLYLQRPETRPQAREALTHATKLLTLSYTCAAMDPGLKMHLHATLRDLVDAPVRPKPLQRAQSVLPPSLSSAKPTVVRSDSSSRIVDKSLAVFSLWTHVLGTDRRSRSTGDSIKVLILAPVLKPCGSIVVEVVGAHGVHKSQFRVFYDVAAPVEWLRDHIMTRYQLVLGMEDAEAHGTKDTDTHRTVAVELFYDPQRKVLLPPATVLSQWIPTTGTEYRLHAKLAPRVVSSHRLSKVLEKPTATPEAGVNEGPSVLCSLCGRRIPLAEVETHSDTCF